MPSAMPRYSRILKRPSCQQSTNTVPNNLPPSHASIAILAWFGSTYCNCLLCSAVSYHQADTATLSHLREMLSCCCVDATRSAPPTTPVSMTDYLHTSQRYCINQDPAAELLNYVCMARNPINAPC